MRLIPDKQFASVSRGKAANRTCSVLPRPERQIGRNADIKRAIAAAGENVNGRLSHDLLFVISRREVFLDSRLRGNEQNGS